MDATLAARFSAFSARLKAGQSVSKPVQSPTPTKPPKGTLPSPKAPNHSQASPDLNLNDDRWWKTTHQVITGQIQECSNCGHVAECTTGVYHAQTHLRLKAKRLVAATPTLDLAMETRRTVEGVLLPFCILCNHAPLVDDILAAVAATTTARLSNQLPLPLAEEPVPTLAPSGAPNHSSPPVRRRRYVVPLGLKAALWGHDDPSLHDAPRKEEV